MASKYYQIVFGGDGNPATQTGLSPTFIQFRNLATGATTAPPGITEIYAGIYRFQYDAPVGTQISFICDGGSTVTTGRYITGDLTALQGMDVVLGSTASSIGSTAIDPGDIMGQLMRNQERWEGLASFSKTSGIWSIQTRGGTTIFARTLANSSAQVVKT
jgi:hypothetical protein